MVSGNTGIISEPILRENKVILYREHPERRGEIMVMPNLPNGLHEAEVYRRKGYKRTPQEIDPYAEVVRNPEGGLFLIRKGERLESYKDETSTPLSKDKWVMKEETYWRVVKGEAPSEDKREVYVSDKEKHTKK